jgi:UDP-N-acetylmuramoyl-L-alanyl-D-glutamate--2,6-diaminopimelate ligase
LIEPDRRTAIRRALTLARAGDVVCLAGKGHQTGFIVGDQVLPFDDREEAGLVLRELESKKV